MSISANPATIHLSAGKPLVGQSGLTVHNAISVGDFGWGEDGVILLRGSRSSAPLDSSVLFEFFDLEDDTTYLVDCVYVPPAPPLDAGFQLSMNRTPMNLSNGHAISGFRTASRVTDPHLISYKVWLSWDATEESGGLFMKWCEFTPVR
jgi:hypothetical protein